MHSHRFLALWLGICVLAVSWRLGGYPLLDPDEGRNGEVAREMAVTNDYVLPRLNTLPYLDKPVVYFAAAAATMELLGATELAARLPALLFTLATAGLLFWFARRIWDEQAGYLTAIVFLSMPLTIAFARTVIFDSALSFFVVLALIAFFEAVVRNDRRAALLAWAAMGAGVSTKGPVAILLPLLVAIPFAFRLRRLRALAAGWGFLLLLVVVGPWLWAVSRSVPDFLSYVLVTETAERLATKALQRTGPPWYFVPYLLAGALPWSLLAFAGWKKDPADGDRAAHARLYVLLWILLPFVFFSLSQSKRSQYILPLMPAVALLAVRAWRQAGGVAGRRIFAAVLAFFGSTLIVAAFIPSLTVKMKPMLIAPARQAAIVIGIAFVISAAALLWNARRPLTAALALTLPGLILPLASVPLLEAIAVRRSAHAFAERLSPYLTPSTRVVGVEAFTGSMAFYLGRPVLLASDDASEFTSNYLLRRYARLQADPRAPVRPVRWFQRTLDECCAPRVYVLRNNDRLRRSMLESRGMRLVAAGEHHVAYIPAWQ